MKLHVYSQETRAAACRGVLLALAEVTRALEHLRMCELAAERCLDAGSAMLPLAAGLLMMAKASADEAEVELHRAIDEHTRAHARRDVEMEIAS